MSTDKPDEPKTDTERLARWIRAAVYAARQRTVDEAADQIAAVLIGRGVTLPDDEA